MPIIPAFRRLKQEDHKLKVNLGYAGNSTPLQKKKPKKQKTKTQIQNKTPKSLEACLIIFVER
jgi:hypothetical protein